MIYSRHLTVCHAGFLCHGGLVHTSYGISGQVFGLILSFLSNKRFRAVLDGKPLQEYPVDVGVCEGSILGPTFFI